MHGEWGARRSKAITERWNSKKNCRCYCSLAGHRIGVWLWSMEYCRSLPMMVAKLNYEQSSIAKPPGKISQWQTTLLFLQLNSEFQGCRIECHLFLPLHWLSSILLCRYGLRKSSLSSLNADIVEVWCWSVSYVKKTNTNQRRLCLVWLILIQLKIADACNTNTGCKWLVI
jgi:hypothetical protein